MIPAALRARALQLWQSLTGPLPDAPSKVGVLNSGELIVVRPDGEVTLFSVDTTSLIHSVLSADFYSGMSLAIEMPESAPPPA